MVGTVEDGAGRMGLEVGAGPSKIFRSDADSYRKPVEEKHQLGGLEQLARRPWKTCQNLCSSFEITRD